MKETHYKLKHRVTALFAAAVMLCSMLPGAAFAEEPTPQPTEETVQMEQQTEPSETDNGQADESSPDPGEDVTEATPETAEEQPAEEEIPAAVVGAELYTDLPNAPIGSYIGSEGLPVATGETKIGISEWPESQLEEGGSYLTAAALDNDGLTMAAPLLDGADYAALFKIRDCCFVDKSVVFGQLAGYFLAEHDLAIHKFVQRFTMLQGQQRGGDTVFSETAT